MGGQNVWRDLNLIPFYEGITKEGILNVIMFLPMGVALPFLLKANIVKVFTVSLAFSVLIELSQLAVALYAGYTFRVVDVNDVIMNVFGAVVGYLILFKLFKLIYKWAKNKFSIESDGNSFLIHIDKSVS
ncbi:glycopeptide antibiotics resistance protein [Virgibacillus natechei]|uniref:Glycopeptide antibiotics resistance protein n=1 Tax=Virgibacillus natechei TaxID=1216297 RepID=A0ABS4ILV3_9BACI|nr:glycopeptide antibiotics resistance protein [Virgibacillus natechei]